MSKNISQYLNKPLKRILLILPIAIVALMFIYFFNVMINFANSYGQNNVIKYLSIWTIADVYGAIIIGFILSDSIIKYDELTNDFTDIFYIAAAILLCILALGMISQAIQPYIKYDFENYVLAVIKMASYSIILVLSLFNKPPIRKERAINFLKNTFMTFITIYIVFFIIILYT